MSLTDFNKKYCSCEHFLCSCEPDRIKPVALSWSSLLLGERKKLSEAWNYLETICLNRKKFPTEEHWCSQNRGDMEGLVHRRLCSSHLPRSHSGNSELIQCWITHRLCWLCLYARSHDDMSLMRNWRTSFPGGNLLYLATDASECLCSIWAMQCLKNFSLCGVLFLKKASICCGIGLKSS